MNKKIKKIGVMTSGGDSPGMNAAVRAVARTCSYYNIECKGIRLGYQGLIEGKIVALTARSVKNILNRGGTVLKTARSEEFRTKKGRQKAFEQIQKHGLDAIVVIGGDGSFTGGLIFEKEYGIPIVGVPGTIDNDIFGTDFTIGYDTALNTVVEAVDKIRDTATSHDRLFFVEVMGRDAGFIALNSGIAVGATEILIPEQDMGLNELFEKLESSSKGKKSSNIIMVSEGDTLGNVYDLARLVKMKFHHFDIRVTVLGHIQRGGSPSCFDRVLASRLAVASVEALMDGESGVMIGIRNGKVVKTSLDKAIKEHNPIDLELKKVADIMSV